MSDLSMHILLVEDHVDIAEIVEFHLQKEGFIVFTASDGEDALKKIQGYRPSLVLLDWMLPKLNGLEVLRAVRAKKEYADMFVIMLTAKGTEDDIVSALEAGADDYVVKPVKPKELIARVRAVLRRKKAAPVAMPQTLLKAGELVIDEDRHLVHLGQEVLELTLTEFQLLVVMVKSTGRIFTRDQLIDKVRGDNISIVDRNVDVHISALRKKMKDEGKKIITVRGVGYRFLDS